MLNLFQHLNLFFGFRETLNQVQGGKVADRHEIH